jgi:hypothetical protein
LARKVFLKILWVNWGIAKKEWFMIFLSAGIRWVAALNSREESKASVDKIKVPVLFSINFLVSLRTC